MGVKSNLTEVRARRQAVFAGDEGRVKAQKDLGKLTARERLTALFDAASFVELNALNEDAGVVAGFGTIDGRGAYAFAQDFTVGLGAVGDAHAKKIAKTVELARDSGSPVIGIYDTAGAKLEEGAMALDAYARIGAALASASGVVPSIALVMGHCGGIAAACAQMQDFVILSKAGELFVNGPQVAGAKSLDDIAGGEAAMKGGACHIVAESDEAALGYERSRGSFLSFAARVIRSRLIDYNRAESRHRGHGSLNERASDDGAELLELLPDTRDDIEELTVREAAQSEIEEFSRALAAFGITFSDVADNCPKQERTLRACMDVLNYARWDPEVLAAVEKSGKLPMTELASGAGVERKTLERHRKYLVAMLIAFTNGFEIIRGHLCRLDGGRGTK